MDHILKSPMMQHHNLVANAVVSPSPWANRLLPLFTSGPWAFLPVPLSQLREADLNLFTSISTEFHHLSLQFHHSSLQFHQIISSWLEQEVAAKGILLKSKVNVYALFLFTMLPTSVFLL